MGVNMVGFAIEDDEACREAARMEIVRRYFSAAVSVKRAGMGEQVDKLKVIKKRQSPRLLACAIGCAAQGRDHGRSGGRDGATRRDGRDR